MKKALVLSLVAFGLIAETFSALTPDDRYFYFSTQGKDCYADGTPLLDGECYAVVWRGESLKNTTSGLFDADGNAVDPDNCQILAVLPAAKRGVKDGQPYAYAAPAWEYIANGVLGPLVNNGIISLFVFDTRIWNGTSWIVGGMKSGTTVAALNGYGLVDSLEDLKIGFHIFPHGGRLGPDHSFTNNPDAYMSWGDVNVPYSGATVLSSPSSKKPAPSRLAVEALHFKTTGNDRYADETPVMAGECYALVWQRTGTEFPGLPKEAPDPADREALGEDFWIAGYYPAATGDVAWACCSNVTVASGALPVDEATNGTWTVYLLDTRYETDGGATACGFDPSETNMPQQINFYAPVAGLTDFELALTASPLVSTNLVGGATVADQKSYSYFEVTLDSCGGTPASLSVIRKEGTTVGSLPDQVTRQGYAFAGWYTAAVGGEPVTADTVVTAPVTYYAHWTANSYTVDFNERGGTGSMDDQPMTYDREETLYSNLFTRVGYTFLGWTDDAQELKEVLYYDGVVVSNLTDEADGEYDLYAVWAANAYTVTFHANGGEGEMEQQEFLYDEEQLLSRNLFENGQLHFTGWATNETGEVAYRDGQKVKNLTYVEDGNVDLYAVWSELPTETVYVGAKTTIDTSDVFGESLKGYSVLDPGLPNGLKYDSKKGIISGTITKMSEIGSHDVTFENSGFEYSMRIVVPPLPTIAVALKGEPDESATNGCIVTGIGAYPVGKKVTLKVTLPKKSKTQATEFLGWYLVKGEEEMPWGKDFQKTSVSYAMTEESLSLVARFRVETSEDIKIGCAGLSAHGGVFTAGVAGAPTGIPLEIEIPSGEPKSVKVTGLPSGMKYDAKTGLITGAPTKAGEAKGVTITVTTVNGVENTITIPVSVTPLPDTVVGSYDGFVVARAGEPGEDNVGTLSLTVKADGKLSAKVITKNGTYSFSDSSWAAVTGSVYHATLKNGKKPESLTLRLDAGMAWNENQLGGDFAGTDFSYAVSAQRHAFGTPWYFGARGDERQGWELFFTNSVKGAAALTVTLKLDGTTTVAGTLVGAYDEQKRKNTTFKISAKGYANVCMMTNGAFAADFAPVIKLNGANKALSIRTNLWMDRCNDHQDEDGKPNIGTAAFVD